MEIMPLGRRARQLRPVLRHRHALAVRHNPVRLPLQLFPTIHWLLPHVLRVHRRKKCLRMRWAYLWNWKSKDREKKLIKCKADIWNVLLFFGRMSGRRPEWGFHHKRIWDVLTSSSQSSSYNSPRSSHSFCRHGSPSFRLRSCRNRNIRSSPCPGSSPGGRVALRLEGHLSPGPDNSNSYHWINISLRSYHS